MSTNFSLISNHRLLFSQTLSAIFVVRSLYHLFSVIAILLHFFFHFYTSFFTFFFLSSFKAVFIYLSIFLIFFFRLTFGIWILSFLSFFFFHLFLFFRYFPLFFTYFHIQNLFFSSGFISSFSPSFLTPLIYLSLSQSAVQNHSLILSMYLHILTIPVFAYPP